MKKKILEIIFALIIGIIGVYLIWGLSVKVIIGFLLILWGNNIIESRRESIKMHTEQISQILTILNVLVKSKK